MVARDDDVYRDWPAPLGAAAPSAYADDRDHAAGLYGVAAGALAGWLAGVGSSGGPWAADAWERCAAQAAALAPGGLSPTAGATAAALHRQRLAAGREPRVLAAALDAWGVDDAERLLIALTLAFELSPAHARLVADVGALWGAVDPIGPTLVACAAALSPAVARPDVAAVADRLGRGGRLARLALIGSEGAEPLWRRRVRVAPRLVALAAGRRTFDEVLAGVALRRGDASRADAPAIDRDARGRLIAAVSGEPGAVVPVVALARRDALDALVDVVAVLRRPVVTIQPSAIGPAAVPAIVREVLLHRAVPVVTYDHGEAGPALLAALRDAGVAHVLAGTGAPPATWLGDARGERLALISDVQEAL